MRLLVYKKTLDWPRRSGHDVHTYEMMRAWSSLGAHVHLITCAKPKTAALDGLTLESLYSLNELCAAKNEPAVRGRTLPERFADYWGIPEAHIRETARIAKEVKADAVITSGLDCIPMLHGISGAIRVWYAADEWVLHHLSLIKFSDRQSLREIRPAIIKGLYEWSNRAFMDRIWVVTEQDRRAMRMVTLNRDIDILPNGVDTNYYSPRKPADELPQSIVFWGRLDFEPNVQALDWFCRKVWPSIISRNRNAVFTIMGAQPNSAALRLGKIEGIKLLPDVADLRPEIERHQIVVLPFISGGGIKNKLLEGAAMGKAIIGSVKAATGLRGAPPVRIAHSAQEWINEIEGLWHSNDHRRALGSEAREWVCKEHSWEKSASAALSSLNNGQIKKR